MAWQMGVAIVALIGSGLLYLWGPSLIDKLWVYLECRDQRRLQKER
jgi:hypothetical protein